MKRRAYLASLAGISVAGLVGCVEAGQPDDYDVGMGATFFDPETIEIDVGETVVWKNTGSRAHTVTAYENHIPEDAEYFASGGFESEQAAREGWERGKGNIYSEELYEHTFEVPGTYEYVCIPHERGDMIGTVIVEG